MHKQDHIISNKREIASIFNNYFMTVAGNFFWRGTAFCPIAISALDL